MPVDGPRIERIGWQMGTSARDRETVGVEAPPIHRPVGRLVRSRGRLAPEEVQHADLYSLHQPLNAFLCWNPHTWSCLVTGLVGSDPQATVLLPPVVDLETVRRAEPGEGETAIANSGDGSVDALAAGGRAANSSDCVGRKVVLGGTRSRLSADGVLQGDWRGRPRNGLSIVELPSAGEGPLEFRFPRFEIAVDVQEPGVAVGGIAAHISK